MAKKRIGKERLDKLLADRGLAESRTKAQALIMAGLVKVNGERVDKAGTPTEADSLLEVNDGRRWASRGAYKLLKAIEVFGLQISGKVCVDIGASTGGFTDVLLDAGAEKIYAVDVGYGQLLTRLANDPRVVVMDRTNARNLTPDIFGELGESVDVIVCDASFISLKLLLPAMDSVLSGAGEAVVLIKPQFEAGRERLGRGGVVREAATHAAILQEVLEFSINETTLFPIGLSWSPVLGPEGNMEFLCHLHRKHESGNMLNISALVSEVVEAAHRELRGS